MKVSGRWQYREFLSEFCINVLEYTVCANLCSKNCQTSLPWEWRSALAYLQLGNVTVHSGERRPHTLQVCSAVLTDTWKDTRPTVRLRLHDPFYQSSFVQSRVEVLKIFMPKVQKCWPQKFISYSESHAVVSHQVCRVSVIGCCATAPCIKVRTYVRPTYGGPFDFRICGFSN